MYKFLSNGLMLKINYYFEKRKLKLFKLWFILIVVVVVVVASSSIVG